MAVLLLGRVQEKAGAALRDFLPILVVLLVFLLLQPLVVAVNPHRWDAALAAADGCWFGRLAAAWRGAFGRPGAFTDLVYLAYASFYFLPITVAVLARLRLAPVFWAWALAVVFATVYIGVHYVADVAAGLLLAGFALVLGRRSFHGSATKG